MALVPPWVRVYRIQRDIPMPLVTSGVEKGNLRELALARMGQLGLRCRDVRTREVGIQVHPCSLCMLFLHPSFYVHTAASIQEAHLALYVFSDTCVWQYLGRTVEWYLSAMDLTHTTFLCHVYAVGNTPECHTASWIP